MSALKRKAVRCSNTQTAIQNTHIKNNMNAIRIIAACAHQTCAASRFSVNPHAGIGKQQYRPAKGCATVPSTPNCGAGAENTVIDSGVHTATLSAVFLRSNFMVLDVRVLPTRKDGSMAESMFSPPSRPSRVPEKRMEWFFQSHSGAEAMTNVISLASRRAVLSLQTPAQVPTFKPAPASPAPASGTHSVERQQAIEDALSAALCFIRIPGTAALQAATGRANRALSLLKNACTEAKTDGAA